MATPYIEIAFVFMGKYLASRKYLNLKKFTKSVNIHI